MDSTQSKKSRAGWIGYLCFCLFVIFYVPTLVPNKLVASESYIFGYNNRVGFILFILLTAIGAIYSRRLNLNFPSVPISDSVQNKTLWKCLAGILCLCIAMYLLTSRLGSFGESTYFINRIELASRGLHPYRDFEFAYGALFIYAPLFISWILHVSIPNAYYLFWTLNVLTGVWFLSVVINWIDYPSKHKNEIFLLLYLFMLTGVVTTGLNYAGFRFLSAPLLGLIVFRSIRDGKLKNQITGSLLAILFTALVLLISPKIGVAFGLGIAVFFFLFYVRSAHKTWIIPYFAMLFLLACLMALANKIGIFYTLKSMGSGGYNFPIIPAAAILMLFLLTFLCACYLACKFSNGDLRSNTVLVLLISTPSLAGSLGRCDPGHVLFNAIGIFIVGLLCISNFPRGWKACRIAFIVIFIAFSYFTTVWFNGINVSHASVFLLLRSHTGPYALIEKVMVHHYGGALANKKLETLKSSLTQDATSDPVEVPSQLRGIAGVPFGYLVTHNPTSLDGGYYFGVENVFDPKAVNVKISELAQHPARELLLPEKYADLCHIDPHASRKLISILFVYPFLEKAVHTTDIYEPLCNYISQNYF